MEESCTRKCLLTRAEIASVLQQANNYFTSKATVLIGSYARNDANLLSDLDVFVVSETRVNKALFVESLGKQLNMRIVAVVRYSPELFEKRWCEGSLFVHHVLSEGKIFYVEDGLKWFFDPANFSVKRDFLEDVCVQENTLRLFLSSDQYRHSLIYFSSKIYLIIKNIAIFLLAQQRTNVFNKRIATQWFLDESFLSTDERPLFNLAEKAYLHISKKQAIDKERYTEDVFSKLVVASLRGVQNAKIRFWGS